MYGTKWKVTKTIKRKRPDLPKTPKNNRLFKNACAAFNGFLIVFAGIVGMAILISVF